MTEVRVSCADCGLIHREVLVVVPNLGMRLRGWCDGCEAYTTGRLLGVEVA